MPAPYPNTLRAIKLIDQLSLCLGRLAACMVLLMAAVTGLVVLLRYGFDSGSLALQETASYLFAGSFMLGAAATLQRQGHVRVDIFYRGFSRRTRAWVDSVGAIIFLLPLCTVIAWASWGYVCDAWAVKESSPDPGGLPAVYLLKSLILVMAASLLLQGIAELLRNAVVLMSPCRPEHDNIHA